MTSRISAIIAQHIASSSRLIIPEIGTLIRRKESGEIVFMEMLKKNDGVLTGLVVNTLDVSPSKAADLVARYTATIKQQLTTNKKFILDGVGVLLARQDGSTDFSFNPYAQSIPEPYSNGVDMLSKEELIPARPAAPAEQAAPQPKEEPVVEKEPVVVLEEEPTPKVVAAPKPATKSEPKSPVRPQDEILAPQPAPRKEQPTTQLPKKAEKSDYEVDFDEEERFTSAPRKSRIRAHHSRRRISPLTLLALVAILMALLSLIWGMIPSERPIEVEVEAPATEVIVVE